MIKKSGFDTTLFPSTKIFESLCREFGLEYDGRIESNCNCFAFIGEDLAIFTTNNPITGEYYMGDKVRSKQKGFADYIGVEGEKRKVEKFCARVKAVAKYIKDFDPNNRSFI